VAISKPTELPTDASDEDVGRVFFEWWNTHMRAAPGLLARVARGTTPSMAAALRTYGEAQHPGKPVELDPHHLTRTGAELATSSPTVLAREFNSEGLDNSQLAQALRWAAKGEFARAGRILKQYGAAQQQRREQQERIEKHHAARAEGGRNAAQSRTIRLRAKKGDPRSLLETHERDTGQRLSPNSPSSVRQQAAAKIGMHPDNLLRLLKKRERDPTAR
jgi:hypothetical protein